MFLKNRTNGPINADQRYFLAGNFAGNFTHDVADVLRILKDAMQAPTADMIEILVCSSFSL